MNGPSSLTNFQNRLTYQTGLLGLMVLLSCAILLFVNLRTKNDIALRMQEDLQASLQQVVPTQLYDNEILKDIITIESHDINGQPQEITFYRARTQHDIVALAFATTGYGYSGAIDLIIGIDVSGKLLGVRTIAHAETPGLGDKIETSKSDWILGFNGLTLSNPPKAQWAVKKDGGIFDAFSGATITPRAVVSAVRHGLEIYSAQKSEILQIPPLTLEPTKSSASKETEGNTDEQ